MYIVKIIERTIKEDEEIWEREIRFEEFDSLDIQALESHLTNQKNIDVKKNWSFKN